MNKFLRNHLLFEDDDLIFVDKPPGLLSVADRFDSEKPHLFRILRGYYPEVYPVHRLDQNTSGVIVFAKSKEIQRSLSELFEAKQVKKEYIALCDNTPPEAQGFIDQPIKENARKKGSYIVSDLGKKALTHYEVVKSWSLHSLLKVSIMTGRTHQIRVHLGYIGCPLMVDPAYGARSEFFLSTIKKKKVNLKKGEDEQPLLHRTPLHAHSISFQIDEDQKAYNIKSELPKDIKAMIYQLDKRFSSEQREIIS